MPLCCLETFYYPAQADVLDRLGEGWQDREGRDGRVREGDHHPPRGRQLAQRSLPGPGDGPTLLGGRQAPSDLQQQPRWLEYQVILEDY